MEICTIILKNGERIHFTNWGMEEINKFCRELRKGGAGFIEVSGDDGGINTMLKVSEIVYVGPSKIVSEE